MLAEEQSTDAYTMSQMQIYFKIIILGPRTDQTHVIGLIEMVSPYIAKTLAPSPR